MATLQSTVIDDTGFLVLPNGTSSNRPSPSGQMTRYNTLTSALEVYDGSAWIRQESIPESGLVCNLDAAKYVSGTTWYDTSGSGNNGTLVGSPTWSSEVGGCFLFNGSSNYISIPVNYTTGTWTVIGASRYTGSIRGRVIASTGNEFIMGHHSGYVGMLYCSGTVINDPYPGDILWRIFAASGSSVADSWQMYLNGYQIASNNGGTAGPNGIELGGCYGTAEMSECEVAFILVYNRVLTPDEITQIYVTKSARFGL